MKVSYQYASPSRCFEQGDQTVLGLSTDLSRAEKVSFSGRLKHPLVFRDAMLMLREIVIADTRQKQKERVEFFNWLEQEIERGVVKHQQYLPGLRANLRSQMDELVNQLAANDHELKKLVSIRSDLKKELDRHDVWKDYYQIERDFWKFIKDRDASLWFVLDPVITVHPDQVSFEAFSQDESTYGCLSIAMAEFELLQEPKLGTTNIDFSAKLAKELERFRTYSQVELSVNPGGFTVDTGIMPEYLEKKIDLPETWIKGFNQVSSAASLGGVDLELAPVDLYDICSFLRRHKAKQSPREMRWILEPGQPVRVVFQPFNRELTLKAIYSGEKKREEKIWGSRRWLVIEKLIPLAESFRLRLLGFGMPQFIIANLGGMKMTIGFSSWSANDWVKGTAFNILAGFIGEGNYEAVYRLLKQERLLTLENIYTQLSEASKGLNKAGVGMLLRRGEGYYDAINDTVRFRQLCNTSLPPELYETTDLELKVNANLEEGMEQFRIKRTATQEFVATQSFKMPNQKYHHWNYRGTPDYSREFDPTHTELVIDQDGQIGKVKCKCKEFNKGSRNISEPCAHILALYINAAKFVKLNLKPELEYKMSDIMEMLL